MNRNRHHTPELHGLKRSKREPIKKLNDFIEASDFEVLTDYTYKTKTSDRRKLQNQTDKQRKEGRFAGGMSRVGKKLLLNDTAMEWYEALLHDCKTPSGGTDTECMIETLREDHPEYCIFGNRCVKKTVEKIIDKKFDLSGKQAQQKQIEEIPEEYLENLIIDTPEQYSNLENIDFDEDIF